MFPKFMLDFYYLTETFQSMRQHKRRSVLTGFGVMWGIFLLVVLLGAGEGFSRGVMRNFDKYAQNVLNVFKRYKRGTGYFTEKMLEQLPQKVPGIQYTSPVLHMHTGPLTYQGKDYGSAQVIGVGTEWDKIEKIVLSQGRFFNQRDAQANRNVCVIGHEIQEALFGTRNALGQLLTMDGMCFKVVGVLDPSSDFNQRFQQNVFLHFKTAEKIFNARDVDWWHFVASLQDSADGIAVEKVLKVHLAEQLRFDLKKDRLLFINNFAKRVKKFKNLFFYINIFLWVVGICMLLSGVVGISNMMLVVVKERTKEIGVRKVIGATSREILLMIMSEAVIISLVAGLVGMAMGVGTIQLLNKLIDYVGPNKLEFMHYLSFKPYAAAIAVFVLVIAGCVAGIIPARKATAILPVQALNED